MATRIYDNDNTNGGVELPPIPINEFPIGGHRSGTIVPGAGSEMGISINEHPLRGNQAAEPTEVIDYSRLGAVKDQPVEKPASQDTRTKVFFGSSTQQATGQGTPVSTANADETASTEPCVGWVVVISGPMKGRSFELQAGQNHIGRDSSNSIVLAQDPGVSRRSHVIITYYHRHNMFNVCRGTEGRGTADLNNQPLEMPTQLNAGDEILLTDDTTLRFVPLCGENFKW